MRIPLQIAVVALIAACGSNVESGGGAPTPGPVAASPVYMKACPSGARPQTELDFGGLPPLVPTSTSLQCLLNVVAGGSTYDGGYNFVIQLTDGRVLQIYERRGSLPVKDGASQSLRGGERDVNGAKWQWATLTNGSTVLDWTSGGIFAELSLRGDESQVDTLVEIARSLRPAEALPRPAARDICAAVPASSSQFAVAGAFVSSAASIVKWEETAPAPVGMRVVSAWRDHPAAEPVTVCYLDGDFGPAKGPAPLPGSVATPVPNWNRVVYLVGVDRRPSPVVFGWQDRITIRDPGP
jgi:hypothetical protein